MSKTSFDLIIHNCQALLLAEDGSVMVAPNQDIVIDGARIVAIQPADPAATAQADEVIDAWGMLAMPGLINTHAHVPMVIFRGLADLILIDLSGSHCQPLHSLTASSLYNVRASDVQTVIVNGRVLMRDRQLLTLDKARIVAEVTQNMARLARCIPAKRIQVYNP